MKKNILLLFVLLCGFTIKAQNLSKQEALEFMANDIDDFLVYKVESENKDWM